MKYEEKDYSNSGKVWVSTEEYSKLLNRNVILIEDYRTVYSLNNKDRVLICGRNNEIVNINWLLPYEYKNIEITSKNKENNMKEIKIGIPQGYEIDKEKSTSERIVFKAIESKYPKSWKDLQFVSGWFIDTDSEIIWVGGLKVIDNAKNVFPTKEYAEAVLALAQLLQLRQRYLEVGGFKGWVADWTDINGKHYISAEKNVLVKDRCIGMQCVISFPTSKLRDLFFEDHKQLLEQAKILL